MRLFTPPHLHQHLVLSVFGILVILKGMQRCSGKESACQYKRCKRHGFNPSIGKIPGVGNGFSILTWKIPWMEEPGRLQSVGSQRLCSVLT